ncbi:MAG: hypothetical protein NTV22_17605, partial [bacterium]|nr:hypothetical protein [bacterium]
SSFIVHRSSQILPHNDYPHHHFHLLPCASHAPAPRLRRRPRQYDWREQPQEKRVSGAGQTDQSTAPIE